MSEVIKIHNLPGLANYGKALNLFQMLSLPFLKN